MTQQGILAIWNDCRAGREAEFEAWFQGEHLLERLAVPGFLFGRRHQAISGACGYFNFYLVEPPAVLTSKPYLERLDHPTPMTRKVMSEIFINMNRTICHRTLRRGAFRGAYAVTARFDVAPEMSALTALTENLVQDAGRRVLRDLERGRSGRTAGVDGRKAARRRQEDQSLPDGRYAAASRCRKAR